MYYIWDALMNVHVNCNVCYKHGLSSTKDKQKGMNLFMGYFCIWGIIKIN